MVLQENAISKFIRTTSGSFGSEISMDDLVLLFTSTARVPPYWIASMNASISKNDTINVQRTPFGRFIHLLRLSASFCSLKCQRKCNVYYLCWHWDLPLEHASTW